MGGSERGDTAEIVSQSIKMGGKLLVMVEKFSGRLTGTSWMTFDGRRIHMHHFGITPSMQGKGLAKPLVKESLKFAAEKGYQVKLEVHQSNTKAVNLYIKSGFKRLGDFDVYIIRNLNEIDLS